MSAGHCFVGGEKEDDLIPAGATPLSDIALRHVVFVKEE
jgi:hypothetical protein